MGASAPASATAGRCSLSPAAQQAASETGDHPSAIDPAARLPCSLTHAPHLHQDLLRSCQHSPYERGSLLLPGPGHRPFRKSDPPPLPKSSAKTKRLMHVYSQAPPLTRESRQRARHRPLVPSVINPTLNHRGNHPCHTHRATFSISWHFQLIYHHLIV